jgi:hypothetical protein
MTETEAKLIQIVRYLAEEHFSLKRRLMDLEGFLVEKEMVDPKELRAFREDANYALYAAVEDGLRTTLQEVEALLSRGGDLP